MLLQPLKKLTALHVLAFEHRHVTPLRDQAFELVAIGETTSTAAAIAPPHTIQVFFTDSSFIPTV